MGIMDPAQTSVVLEGRTQPWVVPTPDTTPPLPFPKSLCGGEMGQGDRRRETPLAVFLYTFTVKFCGFL